MLDSTVFWMYFSLTCIELRFAQFDAILKDFLTFLPTHRVAFVTDKCLVCPGAAMLVQYAFEYGNFDGARDIALLFAQSGWNLRHLGLNVGMGGPVTVFAPIGGSWEQVPVADQERLRTEGWTLHGNDVLKYILVQGVYQVEDLYRIYQEEGRSYSLTALNGEDIIVDYDSGLDRITINGGVINVANLQAVDGYVQSNGYRCVPCYCCWNISHGRMKSAAHCRHCSFPFAECYT